MKKPSGSGCPSQAPSTGCSGPEMPSEATSTGIPLVASSGVAAVAAWSSFTKTCSLTGAGLSAVSAWLRARISVSVRPEVRQMLRQSVMSSPRVSAAARTPRQRHGDQGHGQSTGMPPGFGAG